MGDLDDDIGRFLREGILYLDKSISKAEFLGDLTTQDDFRDLRSFSPQREATPDTAKLFAPSPSPSPPSSNRQSSASPRSHPEKREKEPDKFEHSYPLGGVFFSTPLTRNILNESRKKFSPEPDDFSFLHSPDYAHEKLKMRFPSPLPFLPERRETEHVDENEEKVGHEDYEKSLDEAVEKAAAEESSHIELLFKKLAPQNEAAVPEEIIHAISKKLASHYPLPLPGEENSRTKSTKSPKSLSPMRRRQASPQRKWAETLEPSRLVRHPLESMMKEVLSESQGQLERRESPWVKRVSEERALDIVDRLLDADKVHKEKLEKKRKEKLDQELDGVTFKPRINQTSKRIARGVSSIVSRFDRAALSEKIEQPQPAPPTKKVVGSGDRYKKMQEWDKNRKAKIEEEKALKERNREQFSFKPTISNKAKSKKRDQSVEDWLLGWGQEKSLSLEERRQQCQEAERNTITVGREIRRGNDGLESCGVSPPSRDVFDRLYDSAVGADDEMHQTRSDYWDEWVAPDQKRPHDFAPRPVSPTRRGPSDCPNVIAFDPKYTGLLQNAISPPKRYR